MVFSRKDSAVAQDRLLLKTGLSFSGAFEPSAKDKPFFPTLTKLFLIIGLGFLSWLATYTGMLELILANAGTVDLGVRIAIAFAVAMLMLMIVYLLDALFSPIPWWLRVLYVGGYLFLTLISVGFGFGFYWKYLESRSEATRSAESAVVQVQTALQSGQTRLEQLQTTLTSLTVLSTAKAEQERTKGRTCLNSRAGDGPRRRLRDADASNFAFAGNFVSQRASTVKADITALNGQMAKLVSGDKSTIDPKTGTRNIFLRGLSQNLGLTITRFNALRTDPQLRLFRDSFAVRAEQTVFDNGSGGTFKCPDSQLQLALQGVVKAIDGLPDLAKPTIAAVEGSEAIVEAFRRLTTTIAGALTLKLPPTPQELRDLQQKAVRSVSVSNGSHSTAGLEAGLGDHDFIPFFIAIFVDVCILLVSINRPVNRMQRLMTSAHEARDAKVHQILSRFHTVHEKGRSQRLDCLHEVMFDSYGAQFVAVPRDVVPDVSDGAFGSQGQKDAYKKRVMEARYLASLMAAFEAGGLVTQAPTMTQGRVQKKLIQTGSKFADSSSFRVYRFVNGAWPAIVLDDMLGESAQLDVEATADAAREAADRRMQGPSLNIGFEMPVFGDVPKAPMHEVMPEAEQGLGKDAAESDEKKQDEQVFAGVANGKSEERMADLSMRVWDRQEGWSNRFRFGREEPIFGEPVFREPELNGYTQSDGTNGTIVLMDRSAEKVEAIVEPEPVVDDSASLEVKIMSEDVDVQEELSAPEHEIEVMAPVDIELVEQVSTESGELGQSETVNAVNEAIVDLQTQLNDFPSEPLLDSDDGLNGEVVVSSQVMPIEVVGFDVPLDVPDVIEMPAPHQPEQSMDLFAGQAYGERAFEGQYGNGVEEMPPLLERIQSSPAVSFSALNDAPEGNGDFVPPVPEKPVEAHNHDAQKEVIWDEGFSSVGGYDSWREFGEEFDVPTERADVDIESIAHRFSPDVEKGSRT